MNQDEYAEAMAAQARAVAEQKAKARVQWAEQRAPSNAFMNYVEEANKIAWGTPAPRPEPPSQVQSLTAMLAEARDSLKSFEETLEGIKREPLLLRRLERLGPDGVYVKRGEDEVRLALPGAELFRASLRRSELRIEDEVLLHPKSFQIVEVLGPPPLRESRFAVQAPATQWDDLGGLEGAKGDLRDAVEMPYLWPDLWAHYGAKPVKGILLAGPPGCGKTMLGRAAATALARLHGASASRSGFLYVKGPEILDQFVGQTERAIRDLFFDAQRHREEHGYPALVFIDEADAILGARGSGGGLPTVVPAFLTEMDGLSPSGALVVLATNRPEVLDPAIVRDGRVDRKVTVQRPGRSAGAQILELALRQAPLAPGLSAEEVVAELVEEIFSPHRLLREGEPLSGVVSGAMLVNVVQMALGVAMRRDLSAGGSPSGLCLDDCFAAVDRCQQESRVVKHDLVEVGLTMTMRKET